MLGFSFSCLRCEASENQASMDRTPCKMKTTPDSSKELFPKLPRFPVRPRCPRFRLASSHRTFPKAISHSFLSVHDVQASASLHPNGAFQAIASCPSTMSTLPSRRLPTELSPRVSAWFGNYNSGFGTITADLEIMIWKLWGQIFGNWEQQIWKLWFGNYEVRFEKLGTADLETMIWKLRHVIWTL